MSISFEKDMNPEAMELVKEILEPIAMDRKTALFNKLEIKQQELKKIANIANQPLTVEINKIGDRKELGGIVYELDAVGWKRLPIGTTL